MSEASPESGTGRRRPDATTLAFAGIAAGSGAAVFALEGAPGLREAVGGAISTIVVIAPQIVAGLMIGGLIQQLVPRETVARLLGGRSGLKGIALAGALGMVTPGGPFTSFPLVYALYAAGADVGALVAYLCAWAMIGLNRLIIWELPLLGPDLALLRLAVSLPLPILAGLLARQIGRHPALALRAPT